MSYTKKFDWKKLETERKERSGDRPDGAVPYVYDDRLELAVNVAMASGRPLLLSGKPGVGKSTLAADVAWKLGRRYYTEVITSRTKAQDLQWTFDSVRRLSMAMTPGMTDKVENQAPFITPGVLWRAFEPDSAAKHGERPAARAWGDDGMDVVVLLDEIDKAEPDVPNDLLVVLDQRRFSVRETGTPVSAPDELETLVVITTNGERDLPPAFLRRCVPFDIVMPEGAAKDTWLKSIARKHFPDTTKLTTDLLNEVYGLYDTLRTDAATDNLREPSTAELLDALRACHVLGIHDTQADAWKRVGLAAMWKHTGKMPASQAKPAAGASGSA